MANKSVLQQPAYRPIYLLMLNSKPRRLYSLTFFLNCLGKYLDFFNNDFFDIEDVTPLHLSSKQGSKGEYYASFSTLSPS